MIKDNGEEFIQELLEEEHVCNIILQCLRSRTKAMMQQKCKVPTKEQVEKLLNKKIMSKAKESQKNCSG